MSLAREQFPEAELYEADGVNEGEPTPDVHDIGMWRFVFRVDEGTVFVKTVKPWGDLENPELIRQPWLEDVVIPQPLPMDVTQADKLLKEKGHYSGPYKTVTLRWPLYPGRNEPYYIFGTPDQRLGWYFVGIYSQTVEHVSG
ncbi:hypothetical protein F7Q99_39455 [Streptomyces kaniharaensis]|uniref:Uncharacterized protein n=1 Tax=Streptomyces kaniharaensis TaxID=212423 RepID=A0A6N7L256_9ACTN|nr:hypothetical protein [Streptomyces kaniharaensis]MQS18106.1 hypothetical protein [Streptomyces kaniharaensis]